MDWRGQARGHQSGLSLSFRRVYESLVLRSVLLKVLLCLAGALLHVHAASITLEAENGTLTGNCRVANTVAGYSGAGYVTAFQNANDTVSWDFAGTPGLYDLTIRFRSPFGEKGYGGVLNGGGFSGMFPQSTSFAVFDAGPVLLVSGNNTLQIGGGWNYYEIDAVILNPAPPPPPPLPVPATLCDPQATFAARALMASLVADYGRNTRSGQYDTNEAAYILSVSGRRPAIIGADFMDYSPSRVAFGAWPAFTSEAMIDLDRSGFLITVSWHWNAPTNLLNTSDQPWWRGFYTEATRFDIAAALANTNSVEYALVLRDIDAIAVQLAKFSAANIPVLWRPLHEAEGAWFWWGAKGAEPFKQLWRLLYRRLTGYHNLHNLIWVLSSTDPNWYPGNDVVDIVGLDAYPADRSDTLSTLWEPLKARLNGVKLLALTEFGGVPDIERMQSFGIWWSYFVSWTGTYGPTSMPAATVAAIYQSPGVITLDELNAIRPRIISGSRLPGGSFVLNGTGPHGAAFRILASTDAGSSPLSWQVLATNRFSGGVFTWSDPAAPGFSRRFYRVVTP